MLWLVCFCNYADRQAIFSVFPLLQSDLGLTSLQLGLVGSCFMWMYAIAGPFAGWISDRISPRTVILTALAFWSVVTSATGVARSIGPLLVYRTLGGLGEAFYFPAAMSLIGIYHNSSTRSRAMALHQSSVYAGTVAGGSLSALIAEQHGWRASFFLFGITGIFLAIFLFFALRRPLGPPSTSHADLSTDFLGGVRSVFSSGPTLALIAVFMGANFVAVVFLTWLPTYLYSRFHLSLSQAGFKSTVYLQVASLAGVLVGGWLADRLAAHHLGGRQIVQSVGLALGVPFIFLTGWAHTMPQLILGLTGFGVFKGIYDANIWASLYDVVPVKRRGIAAGTMNSIGWLGGGIAPIAIAAATRTFSLSVCLSATSIIYLGLAVTLILLAGKLGGGARSSLAS